MIILTLCCQISDSTDNKPIRLEPPGWPVMDNIQAGNDVYCIVIKHGLSNYLYARPMLFLVLWLFGLNIPVSGG